MSDGPSNDAPYRLIDNVSFGEYVVVSSFTNLYGCRIGDNSRIGPFVEIQRGAAIGSNCKIESHSFICTGVTIEDEVFVGHGAIFVNDKFPRATAEGRLQTEEDWEVLRTTVEQGATIGSGALILGGRANRSRSTGRCRLRRHSGRRSHGQVVAGNPARTR